MRAGSVPASAPAVSLALKCFHSLYKRKKRRPRGRTSLSTATRPGGSGRRQVLLHFFLHSVTLLFFVAPFSERSEPVSWIPDPSGAEHRRRMLLAWKCPGPLGGEGLASWLAGTSEPPYALQGETSPRPGTGPRAALTSPPRSSVPWNSLPCAKCAGLSPSPRLLHVLPAPPGAPCLSLLPGHLKPAP